MIEGVERDRLSVMGCPSVLPTRRFLLLLVHVVYSRHTVLWKL